MEVKDVPYEPTGEEDIVAGRSILGCGGAMDCGSRFG
jgi:hypothetical protein